MMLPLDKLPLLVENKLFLVARKVEERVGLIRSLFGFTFDRSGPRKSSVPL